MLLLKIMHYNIALLKSKYCVTFMESNVLHYIWVTFSSLGLGLLVWFFNNK